MKKITVVFFLFTAAVCLQAQTFFWDISFRRGKARESVSISQIIRMETGEDFLIGITPAADCYAYVLCYDSNREITVFHNEPMKGGTDIYIGPVKIVDPPGTETLYVIMSLKKQTKLENLLRSFNNRPDSRQRMDNLYREVVKLQNAASGLGEPAGAFIASGGTARSDTRDYVTRFSEKNMYVRAITIRH